MKFTTRRSPRREVIINCPIEANWKTFLVLGAHQIYCKVIIIKHFHKNRFWVTNHRWCRGIILWFPIENLAWTRTYTSIATPTMWWMTQKISAIIGWGHPITLINQMKPSTNHTTVPEFWTLTARKNWTHPRSIQSLGSDPWPRKPR